jgi:hypothetical protein
MNASRQIAHLQPRRIGAGKVNRIKHFASFNGVARGLQ